METYNKECGLSEREWELAKLVDAVRKEPSTLMCIKILSIGFNKLVTPAVSKSFYCHDEHERGRCDTQCSWCASKEAKMKGQ